MRAYFVAFSLGDEDLLERYQEVMDGFRGWFSVLNLRTGRAVEGKEEEFQEFTDETCSAASEVWRRIREILEEV